MLLSNPIRLISLYKSPSSIYVTIYLAMISYWVIVTHCSTWIDCMSSLHVLKYIYLCLCYTMSKQCFYFLTKDFMYRTLVPGKIFRNWNTLPHKIFKKKFVLLSVTSSLLYYLLSVMSSHLYQLCSVNYGSCFPTINLLASY